MRLFFFTIVFVSFGMPALTQQQTYKDSIQTYRNSYVQGHEVVTAPEDKAFFQFFPVDPSYRILCRFEPIANGSWFQMNTSGKTKGIYKKYGRLSFKLHDSLLHLFVYQSQSLLQSKEYKDYLFIPFTDATSAEETYGSGRYLDYEITDIKNNKLLVDFNKAYNPYCAYSKGYECPIPPKENYLPVAVRAGEKTYGKKVH